MSQGPLTTESGFGDYMPTVYIDGARTDPDELKALMARLAHRDADTNKLLLRVADESAAAQLIEAPLPACIHLLLEAGPDAMCQDPRIIRFPAGTPERDIEDFGLAMADAVLLPSDGAGQALAARARGAGKLVLDSAELVDPVTHVRSASPDLAKQLRQLQRLDPESNRLLARLTPFFTRIDAITIETMAIFGKLVHSPMFLVRKPSVLPPHFRKLRRHLVRWKVSADPGPGDCGAPCPTGAEAENGRMAQEFAWLDRAALAGARLFRDAVWTSHFLAFVAVLLAVLGAGSVAAEGSGHGGLGGTIALFELLALVAIVWLVSMQQVSKLHSRWTACRIGAEQIRLARIGLPLLVVPPLMLSPDKVQESHPVPPADGKDHGHHERHKENKDNYAAVALALAKRAVRGDGPCAIGPDVPLEDAALWLRAQVVYQRDYHRANHDRLEAVEHAIRWINGAIFFVVILTVLPHAVGLFRPDWEAHLDIFHYLGLDISHYRLVITAGGPAAAAALHGVATRLEIMRRSDFSRAYAKKLDEVTRELDRIAAGSGDADWTTLRRLAAVAIDAMGSEAEAWHATMLLTPVALPS
jgi:hypothetical protein